MAFELCDKSYERFGNVYGPFKKIIDEGFLMRSGVEFEEMVCYYLTTYFKAHSQIRKNPTPIERNLSILKGKGGK